MRFIFIIGAAVFLAGCDSHNHDAPDATACNDFRIITFYDNERLPLTKFGWGVSKTMPVCVVGETKVARP